MLALTDEAIYQATLTLQHLKDICGPLNSRQITQSVVDRLVTERSKHVSRYTLNKDISNLRAFLNWGKRNKYISDEVSV